MRRSIANVLFHTGLFFRILAIWEHLLMQIRTHTRARAHTHAYTHKCTHTHTHTYTHTHAYTHTYTRTHTHRKVVGHGERQNLHCIAELPKTHIVYCFIPIFCLAKDQDFLSKIHHPPPPSPSKLESDSLLLRMIYLFTALLRCFHIIPNSNYKIDLSTKL